MATIEVIPVPEKAPKETDAALSLEILDAR